MNNPATLNAMAVALDAKELAAEGERSPKLKAAYDAANTALAAVYAAAKAVTDKLAAEGATIAGAATEIAALTALYPAE